MNLTQDEFVAARKPAWERLERLLVVGSRKKDDGPKVSEIGSLYRELCRDVMRARSSHYSHDVVMYLDALAARSHNSLYGARPIRIAMLRDLVMRDFPRALRANARFFWLALLLFGGPLVIGLLLGMYRPEMATSIIPKASLQQMAENYSQGFAAGRGEGQDAAMTGFYVYNNIGIAFRCFATGVLFGAGTVFFLLYNGLVIGTVLGYVIQAGYGRNILTFVTGHGAFELTAIVIAGAAGLRMGHALLDPEGYTRIESLRRAGPEIGRIIMGAAIMLAIAALIEGFWSPSGVPDPIKWFVAGLFWVLVVSYLAFAGRDHAEQKVAKESPS